MLAIAYYPASAYRTAYGEPANYPLPWMDMALALVPVVLLGVLLIYFRKK